MTIRSYAVKAVRAAVVGGLCLSLTACDPGGGDGGDSPVAAVCPVAIAELASKDPATGQMEGAIDLSLSAASPRRVEAVKQEALAIVDDAVDSGTALRLMAFTSSESTTIEILDCPTMAAGYHNPDAKDQKTAAMKEAAERFVAEKFDEVLVEIRELPRRKGTSVVGGLVALATSEPLGPEVTHREAIVVTDGVGIAEEVDIDVDLSLYASVGFFGVGRTDRGTSTPTSRALVKSWTAWLTAHHAASVHVTSGDYH